MGILPGAVLLVNTLRNKVKKVAPAPKIMKGTRISFMVQPEDAFWFLFIGVRLGARGILG